MNGADELRTADLPMNFADATLVVLAEALPTNLVLTMHRSGFDVFRFGRNRTLRIVP